MTWKSMLFTNKPLVVPCIFQNENGDEVVEAVDFETYENGDFEPDLTQFYPKIASPGHRFRDWDTEFDQCFSAVTSKKPQYEYMFGFTPYDHVISKRYSDYGDNLKDNEITRRFLKFQLKSGITRIYMMPCLYIDHVITDIDFENTVSFHLSDYCFEFG